MNSINTFNKLIMIQKYITDFSELSREYFIIDIPWRRSKYLRCMLQKLDIASCAIYLLLFSILNRVRFVIFHLLLRFFLLFLLVNIISIAVINEGLLADIWECGDVCRWNDGGQVFKMWYTGRVPFPRQCFCFHFALSFSFYSYMCLSVFTHKS